MDTISPTAATGNATESLGARRPHRIITNLSEMKWPLHSLIDQSLNGVDLRQWHDPRYFFVAEAIPEGADS